MNTIWILDDEPGMRWVLEKALDKAGWPVRSFADGIALKEALDALEGTADPRMPAVLVSDIRMPGPDGLSVLAAVRARLPDLPVIMMTAYTDLDTTVAAFEQGAFDYLAKPFDIQSAVELIARAAQSAPSRAGAVQENQTDAWAVLGEAEMAPSQSPAMQDVFRAIGRLSQSGATVLITGESGTGKELVARALHRHSRRADGPFVAVNAAAIPRDLLEAELFGHERGAFTGAVQSRRGRFEEADGGTLFLDEIGDMPAELQTRLLRVLAEGAFYRVGGARPVRADVRIVAATHQPLEERVRAGLFRADLFHRLNVIRLRLPPLRERREDIESLARHFLARSAAELGVPVRRPDASALEALRRFDYPGNIRQLENICQWLTVMAPSAEVGLEDLPPEILGTGAAVVPLQAEAGPEPDDATRPAPGTEAAAAAPRSDWRAALEAEALGRLARRETGVMDALQRDFERALLRAGLRQAGGRRGEAALRLGIGRNTLTRKCRELGLDEPDADQAFGD
ncbi:nitrogen regulation protein NR(I) [Castellaniella sp.]|jgi:two-component system nitrogen regulation response regulator GlnG|uniref:nitrogen regulation protein NR(I) n=1 Tax=Castellaniella sp. TaxID=1955812 RepID=UPI002D7ED2C6|nr:nitrogen regulation protein NR(I) [Castellaniella sp.]HET8703793.1 nitrogen regulation protein NR(I) [Castellaniella sp.]